MSRAREPIPLPRRNPSIPVVAPLVGTALAIALTGLGNPEAARASGPTLEEVVAKHVEAHGGAEAWTRVNSMKLTGSYTGFSMTQPFTLHRQRHGVLAKYHMDKVLGDKPREIGWDGDTAWWRDGWTGNPEWARKLSGPSLAVALQDAEMPTPLFDWRKKGYELELLGPDEVEGTPTLGLKLTRPSGEVETWHLDAETYLELARDAVCDEFGRPIEGRMFFDDFRTVGEKELGNGVVIPFYTEVEWRTRHRVMQVEKAEVNVAVDPDLFAPPPPPGMAELLPMVGSWKVEGQRRSNPGAPLQPFEDRSEITPGLDRTVLEERRKLGESEVWTLLSYDRFHDVYRQTAADGNHGRINVLEGRLEDGRLVLDNAETGTTLIFGPTTVFERRIYHEIGDDSFRLDAEISLDGGETWIPMVEQTYRRETG